MHVCVFVYGTLRCALGHPMARLLDRAEFIAEASVPGRLYDLGAYPALVRGRSARERVYGEVYRLRQPKLMLQRLDAYEGCRQRGPTVDEYRRQAMRVQLQDGRSLTAWVYVYNRAPPSGGRLRSGDYLRGRRAGVRWTVGPLE